VRDPVGAGWSGEGGSLPRMVTVGPSLGESVGTGAAGVFRFRDGLRVKGSVKGAAMRRRSAESATNRSWRWSPSRQRLDEVEATNPADRAARQRRVIRGGGRSGIDRGEVQWRCAGGRCEEGSPCLVEQRFARGTEEAVVADFGEPRGQDVLQEAADERDGVEGTSLGRAGAAVAVAEGDVAVLEAFEAAVDEGDAEDVPGQVVEHLGAAAGVLEVDDPLRAPDRGRGLIEEAGRAEGRAELGAEEAGQREAGDEEGRSLGGDPGVILPMQSACRDEDVDMGMVEQRARPGVEDGEQPGASPEVAGIGGELEQRRGGGRHKEAVDELLVRLDESAEIGREGEGDEVVRAGQQARALFVQPALGLVPVALGAVPVAARVVAVLPGAAVIARLHVAAEGRGAAGFDVAQGAPMRGQQARGVELPVDLPDRADDVRELEHRRGRPLRGPASSD